jgi:transposase
MGRPSKWTPEFREEVVRLYRAGSESIPQVARGLGLNPETFRKWVKQALIVSGEVEGYTREEKAEIVALRRRVARLEEEKQILQKAGGVFRQGDRSAVKTFRLVDEGRGVRGFQLRGSKESSAGASTTRSLPPVVDEAGSGTPGGELLRGVVEVLVAADEAGVVERPDVDAVVLEPPAVLAQLRL